MLLVPPGRNQEPAGSGDPASNSRNVPRNGDRVTSRGEVAALRFDFEDENDDEDKMIRLPVTVQLELENRGV